MGKEERNTYTIQEEEIGQVQIADEVVAIIAGLAAMEVDGVSSMAGTSTRWEESSSLPAAADDGK